MGSASVISVEEQLREAGIRLLGSPSSADELLVFLDRAEELLCNIQQAPPISVKEALFPMMKALKADTLLKHSDVDVRVSVASCIHEITRITAPKEPYNDDLMKEIFKLTVSALENLSHPSTRCYKKATSIIFTIARVRSFLVMVDLECYTLIVEMFEHFLKHARLNHSEDVLWAMEQIMTLVLDETEDISLELLRPLLASVQKENQNVAPISWELGNKVISNCAIKLTPFVGEAVQYMDAELEDFAPIIASLCQSSTVTNEQNYAKDSKEQVEELAVTLQELGLGSDPAPKSTSDSVPGQTPKDDATSTSDSKAPGKSGPEAAGIPRKRGRRPNSLMNPEEGYGEYWTNRENTTPKPPLSRKSPKPRVYGTRSKIPGVEEKNLPSNIDAGPVEKLEANGDGDHNSWSMPSGLLKPKLGGNALEPSENSSRNNYKDSKWQPKQQTSSRKRRKDPKDNLESGMLTQDASIVDKVIAIVAANNKIEEKAPFVSVKIHKVSCEDECRSEGTSNMSKLQGKRQTSSRKRGKATPDNLDSGLSTQDTSVLDKEISDVAANKMSLLVSKVSSEGQRRSKGMHKMSNLPGKQPSTERKRRKPAAGNLERDSQDASIMDKEVSGVAIDKIAEKTPAEKTPQANSGDECRSEGIPKANRSSKMKANKEEIVEKTPLANRVSNGDECRSEGIPKTNRSLKRKANKEEIVEKTPLANKVSSGDECRSERIPKANRSSKRKANKEEEPGQHYSSEQIVGRRIRVWWPMDKRYYEGLVDSYDHKKKRYLVVYSDGEVERLNLLKKRWEFVEEDNSTSLKKDTDVPKHEEEEKDKHSHKPTQNLRNTPRSIKNANPYQLVKRTGASSSALRLEEAADGSDSSQPPIIVKVEDYINSDEEEDSEATISETETTISL